MISKYSFLVALTLFLTIASGCAATTTATREIAFAYNPARDPSANYAAFQATAKKECRSRDIRRIDGVGSEYHCRAVLLERAVTAADDPALEKFHRERDPIQLAQPQLPQ